MTRERSRHPIRRPPIPALVLALALPSGAGHAAAALAAARPQAPAALSGTPTMFAPYPYRPKECAFLYTGGLFHLFYIRNNIRATSDDSTEVDFGHAVSANLTDWAQLDPVLHVRPGKWDDLHVWSPSIIEQDGTFYMFYTGVTRVPFQNRLYQRTGLATSTDLMNWTRYDEPVFDGNRVPWALADSSVYEGCQFRDPFVLPDPEAVGHWLMYYVTTPRAATNQLIVGIATNQTGLSPWQDLKPMWNTDAAHYLGFIEAPLVFDHAGRWYLFFTTNSGHPIRYQHAASPTADSTGWVGTYRLYDNDPTTDGWFAPEFLRVGEHEYFAAPSTDSRGIEIREMVWTGIATFHLTTPTVVGVAGGRGRGAGPGLRVLGGGPGGAATKFAVTLPWGMEADVGVYDVAGRRIRVLSAGALPAGETVLTWDRKDDAGRAAGAGVYVVRLRTPLGARSAKASVLR